MKQYSRYFKYESINTIYYHIIFSFYFDEDKHMAHFLNMAIEQYRNMLCNNFGAKLHYGEVVFTDFSKLKKALHYLDELFDAVQIADKLSGC